MENSFEELDDLVQELKGTKKLTSFLSPSGSMLPTKVEDVTEDNLGDFIIKKSTMLIQQGIDTIEETKKQLSSTSGNSEEVEAYAKLIASVATSIEILNKIHIQNNKHKGAKEIKQLEIDNSKSLLTKYGANGSGGPTIQNQTNNITINATREEIMKAIVNKATEVKAVDADFKITANKEITEGKSS